MAQDAGAGGLEDHQVFDAHAAPAGKINAGFDREDHAGLEDFVTAGLAQPGALVDFEADPMPLDPRRQPASFTTDDVPLDLGRLRKLAGQLSAEVPLAGGAPVAEHRGGLFTMSPDGRFLAGPMPDVPGLWVASGCNGSGFSCSPALGELLAAWITEDAAPPSGRGFSPGRFGRLTDEALVEKGTWQYAHYYDPAQDGA